MFSVFSIQEIPDVAKVIYDIKAPEFLDFRSLKLT